MERAVVAMVGRIQCGKAVSRFLMPLVWRRNVTDAVNLRRKRPGLLSRTAMTGEVEVNGTGRIERQLDGYGASWCPLSVHFVPECHSVMGSVRKKPVHSLRGDQGVFDLGRCSKNLRQCLPEVDVLTRDEFEQNPERTGR